MARTVAIGIQDFAEFTIAAALQQIEKRQYATPLMAKGIPAERIRSYGIAFCGKEVLIG